MRCRAIVAFATKRGLVPSGAILNIPDHLLAKLVGKVEAIDDTGVKQIATADDYTSTPPPSQSLMAQDRCQARKVGGRICGAPLKEGINGFLSCSDMACQVPATPHGLVPRCMRKRTLIN